MQTCFSIVHASFPMLHGDDCKFAVFGKHVFSHQHSGKLSASKSVNVWYFELAYERDVTVFHEIPFHFLSSDGVGSVEYDKFDSVFSGRFHSHAHSTDVSKGATTYILYVVDKHINTL